MRIVFATSDWALTGPAEPMLGLAQALRARGHEVSLALPESPSPDEPGVAGAARERGLAPDLVLQRERGVHPIRDRHDAARLRALVERCDAEIVHAWHSRGHGLAWMATWSRRRSGQTVLVRSHRSFEPPAATPWNRALFGPGCDGLWCVSEGAARGCESLRGGRPVAGAVGGIDLERFAGSGAAAGDLREALGLPGRAMLVGVIARVQRRRRFDLLLEAFRRLMPLHPALHLVLLGRGTHIETVAKQPSRELGLTGRVHFPGHLPGDGYVAALQSLDFCSFLVPGSDGGCRAVLEAAACGVPCVALRRGALPEIVEDGVSGLLVEESPEALAAGWSALAGDDELRQRLGAGARARALRNFDKDRLAARLEAFYGQVQREEAVPSASA